MAFPPAPRALTSNLFQEAQGVFVPTAKSLNHQRLEEDASSTAIVEVFSVFLRLSHLYCCARDVEGAEDDSVLDGRDDADVKGYFAAVDPIADEDG